jgi:hypothetical protein
MRVEKLHWASGLTVAARGRGPAAPARPGLGLLRPRLPSHGPVWTWTPSDRGTRVSTSTLLRPASAGIPNPSTSRPAPMPAARKRWRHCRDSRLTGRGRTRAEQPLPGPPTPPARRRRWQAAASGYAGLAVRERFRLSRSAPTRRGCVGLAVAAGESRDP